MEKRERIIRDSQLAIERARQARARSVHVRRVASQLRAEMIGHRERYHKAVRTFLRAKPS